MSESVYVIEAMYEYVWLDMTAFGIDVVPDVNSSDQMSSPWIVTSGSTGGCDAIQSSQFSSMITSAWSRRSRSAASTIANRGSTRSIAHARTSGAISGLTGTATMPALAMPIIVSSASTELSQYRSTRSAGSRPAAISALRDLVGDLVALAIRDALEVRVRAGCADDRVLVGP